MISLPFNSNPCISAFAFSALASSAKVTKPNPLDLPENLSVATKASVISPYFPNASFKS
ncbi:secreted protein [sediment metagenome]|uniref:Secreted protein n=1 Tax=sediment metagenome TaxID=749907 RepID=D9PGS7_9ZZZZ